MKPLIMTVTLLCGIVLAMPAMAVEFAVIVHPDNPLTEIKKDDLSGIFLTKTKTFPGDKSAEPVEPPEDSPAYKTFVETVHGKSVNDMKAYWARIIFSGRGKPPRRLASAAEVVEYVATHPEAIGYAPLGAVKPNVKRLEVR